MRRSKCARFFEGGLDGSNRTVWPPRFRNLEPKPLPEIKIEFFRLAVYFARFPRLS